MEEMSDNELIKFCNFDPDFFERTNNNYSKPDYKSRLDNFLCRMSGRSFTKEELRDELKISEKFCSRLVQKHPHIASYQREGSKTPRFMSIMPVPEFTPEGVEEVERMSQLKDSLDDYYASLLRRKRKPKKLDSYWILVGHSNAKNPKLHMKKNSKT